MKEKINKLDLPVEFPNQLILRKGKEHIATYDPVVDIKVTDDSIIINNTYHEYEHKFTEFDDVYVAIDEPVEL